MSYRVTYSDDAKQNAKEEDDPFFRRMVLGDYLLFYDVNEERKLVTVHRIFHHARDIARLLVEYREQM